MSFQLDFAGSPNLHDVSLTCSLTRRRLVRLPCKHRLMKRRHWSQSWLQMVAVVVAAAAAVVVVRSLWFLHVEIIMKGFYNFHCNSELSNFHLIPNFNCFYMFLHVYTTQIIRNIFCASSRRKSQRVSPHLAHKLWKQRSRRQRNDKLV